MKNRTIDRNAFRSLRAFLRKFRLLRQMKKYGKIILRGDICRIVRNRIKYSGLRDIYPNAARMLYVLEDADEIYHHILAHDDCGDAVKFSVLVPLYNTPEKFLREMIESVCVQTYGNWELCLGDGSDEEHRYVETLCNEYRQKDRRICYRKLEKNYGISGNTNECIKMASGNYVALLDHDDFLHPEALFQVAKVIEQYQADYIYTDEASFRNALNQILIYHFKPDYAPDNLRANNYICHFSVFHRQLLDDAGWYNPAYDGSQDHDLILRLTEKAKEIRHLSGIYYFWRMHPGSTSEDTGAKSYAVDAGKRAVHDSIARMGMENTVESTQIRPSIYRIRYELTERPFVSILIPNKNQCGYLRRCISSILEKTTYSPYEIVIIDNGSDDAQLMAYYDALKEKRNIRVIHWDELFHYSRLNNYGVQYANGKYLVLLNNDTEVITPGWLEEMLMYAQRGDVGAVGAKLYYEDDTIQHAGVIIGVGPDRVAGHCFSRLTKDDTGYMVRLHYAQNISAVTGACLMVRKALYEQAGGLDEAFQVAYNDVDFCLKLRQMGYLNIFTPFAELYHYESKTRGAEDTPEKQRRFQEEVRRFREKWADVLEQGDPYYNRQLSSDSPYFEREAPCRL